MCSLFDNRIYWRLSPAIMGGVKYIASSRPDVNRIRRTISLSNRRPLGDRIGGLLANPLRVKLTSASSSQQSLNYYPLSSASLADHPAVHRIFLFPHSFARNAEKSRQWLQGQGISTPVSPSRLDCLRNLNRNSFTPWSIAPRTPECDQ